jgi:hypothetical protein
MNPTDTTLPRQARLGESLVVPYDDPRWLLSPFEHNGYLGDADFWELGKAIPAGARFAMPTRNVRPTRRRGRHE